MRIWAVCVDFVRMLGLSMRRMGVAGVGMRLMCMVMSMCRIGSGQIERRAVRRNDIHFGSGNSAARHPSHLEARSHIEGGRGLLKQGKGNAGVHQRA